MNSASTVSPWLSYVISWSEASTCHCPTKSFSPRDSASVVRGDRQGSRRRIAAHDDVRPGDGAPTLATIVERACRDSLKTHCGRPALREREPRARSSHAASTDSMFYALYAWSLRPFAIAIWSLSVLPMTLAMRRHLGREIARITCRALRLSVQVEGELPDASTRR